MYKFSVVTIFGLTIISALHTSFAVRQINVLHQYNEVFSLFGDLDQQLGTNSQAVFEQYSDNGNDPNQGALTAASNLKQNAAAQDYYRNNAVLRTALVDRIKLYFNCFRAHDIPLLQIPGFRTIQEFRLQMEFPPDD